MALTAGTELCLPVTCLEVPCVTPLLPDRAPGVSPELLACARTPHQTGGQQAGVLALLPGGGQVLPLLELEFFLTNDSMVPYLFTPNLTRVCASHTLQYLGLPGYHVYLSKYRFGWELGVCVPNKHT